MPQLLAINTVDGSYVYTTDDGQYWMVDFEDSTPIHTDEATADLFRDNKDVEDVELYYSDLKQMEFMATMIRRRNKDMSKGDALSFNIGQAIQNNALDQMILDKYASDMDELIWNTDGQAKVDLLDLKNDVMSSGRKYLQTMSEMRNSITKSIPDDDPFGAVLIIKPDPALNPDEYDLIGDAYDYFNEEEDDRLL